MRCCLRDRTQGAQGSGHVCPLNQWRDHTGLRPGTPGRACPWPHLVVVISVTQPSRTLQVVDKQPSVVGESLYLNSGSLLGSGGRDSPEEWSMQVQEGRGERCRGSALQGSRQRQLHQGWGVGGSGAPGVSPCLHVRGVEWGWWGRTAPRRGRGHHVGTGQIPLTHVEHPRSLRKRPPHPFLWLKRESQCLRLMTT